LIPKLLNEYFVMQYRRSRLNYKARESWLFSDKKLKWRIFISIQIRT